MFKKALDKIHGKTLQIWGFLNIGNIQFFNPNLYGVFWLPILYRGGGGGGQKSHIV